jgi:hypothetical protein
LENANPAKAPMAGDLLAPAGPDDKRIDKNTYLEAISSLNWCAVATRPADPTVHHYNAAKTVAHYLKGTKELGIIYRKGGGRMPIM